MNYDKLNPSGKRDGPRIPKHELENNATFDPNLVFAPRSPMRRELRIVQDALTKTMQERPLPKGYKTPFPTGKQRERVSQRNVETLLANIYKMRQQGKPTLALALSHSAYARTALSGSGMRNLIELAAHPDVGLLELKKGFRGDRDSRLSRIKPTQALYDLLDTAIISEDDVVSVPVDLINLRVGKDKTPVPRAMWEASIPDDLAAHLSRVGWCLDWFNTVIGKYKIDYIKDADRELHYLYPMMYIVYTDDFEHGGRIYTGRGGHQNLSKQERSEIRFNKQPSVELDYGGLHIRMLYHMAGIEYPLDADPYAAVLATLGLDPESVFRDYGPIRGDLKSMLLALICGTGSTKQAISRANRRLFHSWHGIKNDATRAEERTACEDREARWALAYDESGKPTAKPVIEAFWEAHQPISEQFASGAGLSLQNIDAAIAREVMLGMTVSEDGVVPCLPVHDSFIVPKASEDKLRAEMIRAYKLIMQKHAKDASDLRIPVTGGAWRKSDGRENRGEGHQEENGGAPISN